MSATGSAPVRVLVADDEPSIRFVLRETLEDVGCEVVDVASGDAAMEVLASETFELAFFDIRMPGASGLDLLVHLRGLGADTAVVIITAQNTFENAVEAMKRGALDYLVKPFGIAEVQALVEKARRARALEQEVHALRREVGRGATPGERLVGKSAAMLDIFKTIGRVAARDISVLVTGESGTGKELVARAIHNASGRAEGPFVAVNTAAIPRELLESELFGHERGAFTGAVAARVGRFRDASGGTLFLDEIGDMSIDLQAKLLRVLQAHEITPVGGRDAERIDVRIVAATHRDLDAGVREGRFREDLLYRLRVVPMHIAPLREHTEDIPVLADHFFHRYAPELAEGTRFVADAAIERLTRHAWPGNVRELENAIKRALVLSSGDVLTADDFAFLDQGAATDADAPDLATLVGAEVDAALAAEDASGDVYRRVLERVERPLIATALARTDGNQIRAAALLGINRNTLRKKIVELGIPLPGEGVTNDRVSEGLRGLHVLADASAQWKWDPVEQAQAACLGGATVVQLRAKDALDRDILAWGREIRASTRQHGVLFFVNDRFDLALALAADGVHLGQDDLPPRRLPVTAREGLLVGRSTHTAAQVRVARTEPIDYVAFGPVFGTTSKDSLYAARGTAALADHVRRVAPLPVVAIGGIDEPRAREVAEAGATAAVISAVASALDPALAVRALVAALRAGRDA